MKKTVLALSSLLFIANAHASCPANINGTWVGSATKIDTSGAQSSTSFKVFVGVASGSQFTITKAYTANGTGPTATDGPFPTISFNLDRGSCTFSTTDGSEIYGAVSNGGKTLQIVQGANGEATTMTFNKQ